ncbi:MAG: PQQ-dependent sugar dehydrogenase [Phycisphaerae bacterium]|nr:PQQ-dependent sugar dehydrogenase [Phycisphaerae bacterium]
MARSIRILACVLAFGYVARVSSAQGVDKMWTDMCAKCHGDRGQGGGAGTRTLLDATFGVEGGAAGGNGSGVKQDRFLFDAIKTGMPDRGMEAFGQTLTDAQIWGLVNYLRELQAADYRKTHGDPKPDAAGVYASARAKFRIETVVDKGLKTPWSVAFVPVGPARGMLITNRPGSVVLWRDGTLTTIEGTPETIENGQGGMMDVEVHPEYASNGWVYLAFADPLSSDRASRKCMTKVVRGKLRASGGTVMWTEQQTVFEARPEHYLNTGLHFGCKLAFDPGDSSILYFGIGERGHQDMAQDLTRPNGKIHRVKDTGAIPSDNPFVSVGGGAYPSIWSFGHRNPQGTCFDSEGNLWDTEHGPRGGDELNLVLKGRNYGWPIVAHGINYNGAPFRTPWPDLEREAEGKSIVMPVDRWLPSIGACGLGLVTGDAFPAWRGDLLAGGLSGANVDRVRVKSGGLVEREELLHGLGRVRDVVCGPDGTVYVTLNEPDKVIRLVPAK